MSGVQSSDEQWRFWTAVRAEMRATWWGRQRDRQQAGAELRTGVGRLLLALALLLGG